MRSRDSHKGEIKYTDSKYGERTKIILFVRTCVDIAKQYSLS
jgi:hypothetical protein